MSEYTKEIFATPIYAGATDNKSIIDLICNLAYKWQDETLNKLDKDGNPIPGLMSYHWDLKTESNSGNDFKKFGITTFYTGNLAENLEWSPVTKFIIEMIFKLLGTDCKYNINITNMWATIYPKGAHVPEHVHNNSLYSGVFYAKTSPNCGNIVFKDPSYIAKSMASKLSDGFPSVPVTFTQEVDTGIMILFPSWLPHYTQPNESDEDRIIISFNLDFVE